jgi:hypothetical protein
MTIFIRETFNVLGGRRGGRVADTRAVQERSGRVMCVVRDNNMEKHDEEVVSNGLEYRSWMGPTTILFI